MSVRAYRINKLEWEKAPTFNMTHDEKLIDFFIKADPSPNTDADGCGIVEISVTTLQAAVDQNIDPERNEKLKEDIAWAKQKGDEYVQYTCF